MSISAPKPLNEPERLRTLLGYEILDTAPERAFDDVTLLACRLCNTPIASVSFIDADRQWIKSRFGNGFEDSPRDVAFCSHAILGAELFVVSDAARDARFADHPAVTGPEHIRFYAGAPLVSPEGHALGTLCVLDREPRTLDPGQAEALLALGRQIVDQLRLRKTVGTLARTVAEQKRAEGRLREETHISETLDRVGRTVAAELDLQQVVQVVVDAATEVTQAQYGAFFYNVLDPAGKTYTHYVTSGVPPEHLGKLPTPRITELFGITFYGGGVIRMDDVTLDPRYAQNTSHFGIPRGQAPVRSYLAAPVVSRSGEVLGGLFFGHLSAAAFDERDERLAAGISAQAAVAIDNARLYHSARQAGEKMSHLAQHDALTGLPNRVLFKERVERCIENSRLDCSAGFAVLFMDLDSFKVINDSLGHHVGDSLLVSVARRLERCFAASEGPADPPRDGIEKHPSLKNGATIARMGGDEFTILLDGLSGPADARAWGDRVVRELAKPCDLDGHEVFTAVSIGIANGHPGCRSADDLLRDADAAMYRAKSAGKNCCVVFDSSMHESALVRLLIGADLRRAVDRDELVLHYQPIVSLDTRLLVGFEALVRWRREGKLVNPADFIPVAEDTGLIVPIGTWILREACRQMGQWRAAHPALGPLSMSVNLSRKQFNDPALVNHIREVIDSGRIEAQCLKLEITESVVMEDTESGRSALAQIKALGVGLQMDDFGTGYSSLSFLHRFPLDALKIDRCFIKDVASRRDAVAMLQAIITLAHNLRMKVVGEGLELPEQVALLQALDCDYGQGYLFAKPLEPEAAERFALASLAPAAQAG